MIQENPTATATPPRRTKSTPAMARRLAITMGCMAAYGPFAVDMYLPAFPPIARELGTSVGRVQLTLASFIVGLAVGQILWGTLSDHVGRIRPLACGCALSGVVSAVLATTHSIDVMILARFLMGLGGSAGLAISRAIVRDLFEEREAAKFYSMMMMIGGIGPIVSPFLGTLLLTQLNWRAIFWTMAIFGAFCVAAVLLLIPETLPPAARMRGHVGDLFRSYAAILGNGRFLPPAFSVGCTSAILFTYLANASFVFLELYRIPLALFSVLFAANAVGIYIGSQLNRVLLRRFHSGQLLRAGMGINVCTGVLLIACARTGVGGFPLLYAGLFFCMSSMGLTFPNGTALTMQPFAGEAGTASAMLGVLQFALGAVAGTLAGLLHNGTLMPMAAQITCFGLAARGILRFAPTAAAGD
jgi:DHA1 family bicyclomycin/chloramphenicol resistance-like MFS transporter